MLCSRAGGARTPLFWGRSLVGAAGTANGTSMHLQSKHAEMEPTQRTCLLQSSVAPSLARLRTHLQPVRVQSARLEEARQRQASLRQQWQMPAMGCSLPGRLVLGTAAAVLRLWLCAVALRPLLHAGAPAVHLQQRFAQQSGVLAGQGLLAAPGSHALSLLQALTSAPILQGPASLHALLMRGGLAHVCRLPEPMAELPAPALPLRCGCCLLAEHSSPCCKIAWEHCLNQRLESDADLELAWACCKGTSTDRAAHAQLVVAGGLLLYPALHATHAEVVAALSCSRASQLCEMADGLLLTCQQAALTNNRIHQQLEADWAVEAVVLLLLCCHLMPALLVVP